MSLVGCENYLPPIKAKTRGEHVSMLVCKQFLCIRLIFPGKQQEDGRVLQILRRSSFVVKVL